MTRTRTLFFAVAGGLAVGNLYWAQPLIEIIASSFGISATAAAVLVTVTQLGYAIGIFLIVPLGDVLNRKRLVPSILGVSALMLLAAALAPSFQVLLAALAGVGLTTVSAQILSPLASELAEPADRGKIVGTIASGALIGVLLSRTISGGIAGVWGWEAVYFLAAAASAIMAVALYFLIPALPKRDHIPYHRLLASVFATFAQYQPVLPTAIICAVNFGVFSLFWTSLTYLLTAEPFGYSVGQIGLLGLAGLAGAIAARRAGVFHDRGWSVPATGGALAILLLSIVGAWAFQTSIIGIVIVVIVFDAAAQATTVLGQTRLFALPGNARSRLNTVVVVANFLGGAAGSAIAGPLWALGGWNAVVIAAGLIVIAVLGVWAISRKRLTIAT